MRNVRDTSVGGDRSTAELEGLFPDIIRVMSGVREVVHRNLDLSYNQYKTLAALRAGGALSLDALRRELKVAASTASEMVERLVRLGLVRRTVPPDNRRSLRIAVSARGERYLADLEASLIANYRRLLGELPPRDRARLVGAFRAIIEVLGERGTRHPAAGSRAGSTTYERSRICLDRLTPPHLDPLPRRGGEGGVRGRRPSTSFRDC